MLTNYKSPTLFSPPYSDTGVRFEIAVGKVVFSRAGFWDGISSCRDKVVTGAGSRLLLSKGGFVSVLSDSCGGKTFGPLGLSQPVCNNSLFFSPSGCSHFSKAEG